MPHSSCNDRNEQKMNFCSWGRNRLKFDRDRLVLSLGPPLQSFKALDREMAK